jgi:glycosyltransferase involved in cell wall biosynthesis
MKPATISLIVSTYNWPEALELVLISIANQSVMPHELIIADDGSTTSTRELIDSYRKKLPISVHHLWQEDNGFRKTIILNEAFRKADGNYIVQIDGDIILHPDFIKDHGKNASLGYFIKGSRGMLSKAKSQSLLLKKTTKIHSLMKGVGSKINATRLPLFSPLFYGDSHKTSDLRGCNFAVWKADFVKVNGYNNDLTGWGHEDIELAARLVNAGIKRKQLKMTAVCFHLYHPFNSRANESKNLSVYIKTVEEKISTCENGYSSGHHD